jgi:Holliday junction resolvasome RuvABC endonuclease subunit
MGSSGVTIFDANKLEPVYIGSVQTNEKQPHGKRLLHIENYLQELKEKYIPSVIAIERGFQHQPTSTQVIYRVHGVVNKFFNEYEQIYYPPKSVKEAICRGDATKKYVSDTIKKVYPDVEFKNEDESDSFAVALTYLIKNNLIKWEKVEIKKPVKRTKTNSEQRSADIRGDVR